MEYDFYENPVLNSPYEYPSRHWELDDAGQPTARVVESRRTATFVAPAPPTHRRRAGAPQLSLDAGFGGAASDPAQRYDLNAGVDDVRRRVDAWRLLPNRRDWSVTPETARLLRHWRAHRFAGYRPFFCQIEAAETAIWLAEVAPRLRDGQAILRRLRSANDEANPGLARIALKLATGAGKTAVMAMLIAWQTVNAVRRPASERFTRGFLVVAPGITIRDRLRVLQPNDPDAYYKTRELVPTDMLADLDSAKIVITNYHAFAPRERRTVSAGTRRLLNGRTGEPMRTTETEGQTLRRVMPELMGMKNIMALNDEGHHCYRRKRGEDDEGRLTAEDRQEAKKNEDAARVWISGLDAVRRKIGLSSVVDLSATPFFLRGSGYAEGTLFPWTVCDFSLMDAIESGIVKLPRVPVDDNLPGEDAPQYRYLWDHIKNEMPRAGRSKARAAADPDTLPTRLKTALDALYGHYEKTFERWREAGVSVPPCFIVVCNNTASSKLVYDYISGFERETADGGRVARNGRLRLFDNFREDGSRRPTPRTLLIDSEQLESGDALAREFRTAAAEQIERFRRERLRRTGDRAQADAITDQDLLREAMNTVGKPGALGESIRCVVSVSMLTEGWDASTVTHVLGVRAFGTQLLCEQVVGRALRRLSYEPSEDGRLEVEYADVLGVPFDFAAAPAAAPIRLPKPTVEVRAVSPERDDLEIIFPRVSGYRVDPPADRVSARFDDDSVLRLTPDLIGPSRVRNEGIIGEGVDLDLIHANGIRRQTLAMNLAYHLIITTYRDGDGSPRLNLYGQIKRVAGEWLDGCLRCEGGAYPAQLMYREIADMACERIAAAIIRESGGDDDGRPTVRAVLDPYSPTGSSMDVHFRTSKPVYRTDARKCHVNYVVMDSGWEGEFTRVVESHPRALAYVRAVGVGQVHLRIPPARAGIRQKSGHGLRRPLQIRRRQPNLLARLHNPPRRRRRRGRPAQPRRRNQGLPPRGRQREAQRDDFILDPRRQRPAPLWTLGVRRVHRRLPHAGRVRRDNRRLGGKAAGLANPLPPISPNPAISASLPPSFPRKRE